MLREIDKPEKLRSLNYDELDALAGEIRTLLVDTVLKQGGHLASSLGAVELTLALHYVFHTPEDKILFDVGHQAYVHKILTGRREAFSTLRQKGGLSGFPRIGENPADAFSTGHASTAISAALGLARARDLMGGTNAVVAVVGDGALTGGMCYEALNDAGRSDTPIIVVLNDNEMSISKNVGAMPEYLTRLRQSGLYRSTKHAVKRGLSRLPVIGKSLSSALTRLRDSFRQLVTGDQFFSALGFEYFGPIDGHDIAKLIKMLRYAKRLREPVLLHVVTQKGHGYRDAELHPEKYHGVSPASGGIKCPSYGEIAMRELIALGEHDLRVCALTAAMPVGTHADAFQKAYPDRFFDVGIAEEHLVTMAAGMAAGGLKPYVAIYSTFLQRGYDQLVVDVGLQKLPVTFLIDRAGLVGADGATHQGAFDLSFLRAIPNMIVAAPRDARDLKRLIELSARVNEPMAIRYPKDSEDLGAALAAKGAIEVGQWELLSSGRDVMILATGRMVGCALRSCIELMPWNVSAGVIDARFIKPMDEGMLLEAAQGAPLLVTLEENALAGGFGEGVCALLREKKAAADVLTLGLPDRFVEHASVSEQLEECGLTPELVARAIRERLGMTNV